MGAVTDEAWIVLKDLSIQVFSRDGQQAQPLFEVALSEWRVAPH